MCNRVTARPVSLALRRGEVLGIAGLVGAGRTELLRSLFGLDPVVSGTGQGARVHRRPCVATTAGSPRGSGFLSEDRKAEGLALGRSIEDNLTLLSPADDTPGGAG